MKFTVNRQAFLEHLSSVNKAVNPNSSLVALSGIKVDVFNDHLILTGSDNNLMIRSEIWPGELTALNIQEPGSLVMDFRYVLEILRRMDGDSISLETIDHNLIRITDTSGEYNLNTLDGHKYPSIDISIPEQKLQLKGKLLKDIYNRISYAVAEKEIRQVLTGINLVNRNGVFTASATDSYRLAFQVVDHSLPFEFDITVPKRTLAEVVHLLKDDDTVDVFLDNKKIQFWIGKNLIQSQLIEGQFPNVKSIIPKSFVSTLDADAGELERILERSTIFKGETSSFLVKMKLEPENIEITTDTSQLGSSSQNLYRAAYTGEPLTVCVNGKFMLQAIKALNCEKNVKLEFTGTLRPIRITDPESEATTMIVVPMRNV